MSTPHANSFLAGCRWLIGLAVLGLALYGFYRFGLPSIQEWLAVRETVTDELRLLPVVSVKNAKDANQQPLQSRFSTIISTNNSSLDSYATTVKPAPSQLVSGDSAQSLMMIAVDLKSSGNLADLVHITQAIAKEFPLATVEHAQLQLAHPDSLNPDDIAKMTLDLKLSVLAKSPALK